MGAEQIQAFLSIPELPDVVSYLLILVVFVVEYFVKAYVKKDNKITLNKVDIKTSEINKAKKELEETREELNDERIKLEQERKQWNEEIKKIKQAIVISSGNNHNLVSNGTANQIAKMLENKENVEVKLKEEEI